MTCRASAFLPVASNDRARSKPRPRIAGIGVHGRLQQGLLRLRIGDRGSLLAQRIRPDPPHGATIAGTLGRSSIASASGASALPVQHLRHADQRIGIVGLTRQGGAVLRSAPARSPRRPRNVGQNISWAPVTSPPLEMIGAQLPFRRVELAALGIMERGRRHSPRRRWRPESAFPARLCARGFGPRWHATAGRAPRPRCPPQPNEPKAAKRVGSCGVRARTAPGSPSRSS